MHIYFSREDYVLEKYNKIVQIITTEWCPDISESFQCKIKK